MNKLLQGLKTATNFTTTENGAVALESTNNAMLDAFGTLGGMIHSSEEDIISTFMKAFNEDREKALKLLFYMRDIRGGQGMRRVFRVIVKFLANTEYKDLVVKNLDNFLFFGRGDDVLCLLDTPIKTDVIHWIEEVLSEDISAVSSGSYPSLLAKWLPSENASSKLSKEQAREIAKGLNVSPREYRKTLAKLRKAIDIVEAKMSANKWDEINFEKLPAKAAMIYSDAFCNHVQDKYLDYLKKVAAGDAKVNATSLFPVDIVSKCLGNYHAGLRNRILWDAMWKALPDYFNGKEETGLCVVDTSGSMYGLPMEVAYSLGLYCADKAKGPFHNHFITFSANPRLQEIKGDNIVDKINNMDLGICENTNIEKVFNLILTTALQNNLKQEELPSKLYIISDMQWDQGVTGPRSSGVETFIQTMRNKFAQHHYDLPALVYWNVREGKGGMFQQGAGEDGCCMVSGFSPSLFKSVIDGTEVVEEVKKDIAGNEEVVTTQKLDPIHVMNTTLGNERYNRVVVA